MAINPTRIDLLTRLGYALWKTDQQDEALKLFSQSLEIAREDLDEGNELFWIPYYIAAIHAIQGNKEEALKWMEKAVRAGFRKVRISLRDPILENLHQDEQFKQMMAQLKEMLDEMRNQIEE
jgi:protein kinase/serine/threonine-protein kinase